MGEHVDQGAARHVPVLLAEVVAAFSPLFAAGEGPVRLLDGTLGLGGHSEALLDASPRCELLGLDRDSEALALATARLSRFGGRFHARHLRFSDFGQALDELGWERIDGALLDIGVSSLQLDEASRGFSVHADGPLDMRMDAATPDRPAAEIVNHADFRTLRTLVARFGEDPQAARIARAICEARQKKPIKTTGELARIVSDAYPAAWRARARHHPATRTFQALRMEVNDELGQLGAFLAAVMPRLRIGGRLAVISFHSLEDRMVKDHMRTWAAGCLCSRLSPVCTCHHVPEVRLLSKKPLVATRAELARNPRASSAKLRCAEKIAEHVDDREAAGRAS